MKSLIKWMSGVMVAVMLLALPATKAQAQDDYVSYQTFYDELSPYGQWVNDPQYGNVWVPDAGNDFRPYYSNGYWAMTDYGNTWVSNYAWGWAPFHYGRWTHNPFYGWVWIPGNTWGPAWVSWRWGGGNCGWAPMGPGVSLNMSFGNYNYPNDWWVFVGPQYMYQRNFHNHWRGPRYNSTYINNTTIINNTYNNTYVYGPRANDIERVTHQRVNTHRIGRGERGRTVVNNNTVNIYRPSVRGNANEAQPRDVVRAPREVGKPQGGVRNTRSEFKNMVARGEVKPVTTGGRNDGRIENRDNRSNQLQTNGGRQQPVREQRFDSREENNRSRLQQQSQQHQTLQPQQAQPVREQRLNDGGNRDGQVRQLQNGGRGNMDQRVQRIDRPQPQRQEPQRIERQQPQRMEQRQQMQQSPRMERPQPQRQQPQRMERPQPQRPQPQRMERPEPQRQQPQRTERPQIQQQQRVERPQPQQRQQMQPQRMEQRSAPQAAPRPQPQRQSSAPANSRPGGERGDRR